MSLKNLFILKIYCLFFLILPGCYFNLGGLDQAQNLPSLGDDYFPSDFDVFYLDLDEQSYEQNNQEVPDYDISRLEEYGDSAYRDSPSNCEIPYIEDEEEDEDGEIVRQSSETLICILDIPEHEFVLKDFRLLYNIPEGMCDSVSVGLPWHFNHPLIAGPISEECDLPGEDSGTGYENTRISNSRCVEDEEDLCPGSGRKGINCCYSGSKIDGSEWEPDRECFGGPAVVSGAQEFQRAVLSVVPDNGLRNTISLTNLIALNGNLRIRQVGSSFFQGASTPYANYFTSLDLPIDGLRTINRNTSLPAFVQYVPGFRYIPRLFFEFKCLDDAGEVLHEIFLMIREWNTKEEFNNFFSSGGIDTADPDIEGEEGNECEYENRQILVEESEGCNDLKDLDDYGGSYPRIPYSQAAGE